VSPVDVVSSLVRSRPLIRLTQESYYGCFPSVATSAYVSVFIFEDSRAARTFIQTPAGEGAW
jgi:hypothetical protein